MIVGIDLGTTHTVVAWAERPDVIHVFPLPQLVTRTEVEKQPLLASCLYAPLEGEAGDLLGDDPWAIGHWAKRRGAEIPGRMVASAKSWLCHPSVDRTAAILPWGVDDPAVPRVAPVEAATLILQHVKRAWDLEHPPLAEQDVILTVPASFDEVARELTVAAAEKAGLTVKLLEEPQAAFYDYMQHAPIGDSRVLVCDVGGGTTDLSLIQSRGENIERVAVGHHLLLGGDNMDLALALHAETKLGEKLDAARFGQLLAAARAAKERLLTDDEEVPIAIAGSGARLVGGTLRTSLTRAEAEQIVLDGFFPRTPKDARPERARTALVAFGLPYERDVAITRHVAWFLAKNGPLPDALLLNGGVFRAKRIAERLVAAIGEWGGPPLRVLPYPDPDLAVARGAVAYGLALQGYGKRIAGGAARGYYVGLGGKSAICVVPRGAHEGETQVAAGRTLALVVGRPARFDLYVSDEVHRPGEVIEIDEERFERLPPVAARFEAKEKDVKVELQGELTPVGTLELACVEQGGGRRFRLAFQLRGETSVAPPPVSAPPRKIDAARAAIEHVFGKKSEATEREVKDLLRELERILGERPEWTKETARALFDALIPNRGSRRRSPEHERLFWLLAGYCVRPGFGDPLDPQRIAQLAPLFAEKLSFPDGPRGWQQFWIAWRRAAAGLDETLQTQIREMVDPFLAPAEKGLKKPKKLKPESTGDMLDMASSLERVSSNRRSELGAWILERTWTDRDPRLWAALGRIGARVPAYASLHHVVGVPTVERWLDHLLREKWDKVPTAAQAAAQLARMTGDRARDVNDTVRTEIKKRLTDRPELLRVVSEVVPIAEADRTAFFGDSLPVGLKLVE